GASRTVGSVGCFTPNISSGFGYIALAAMIFGRWTPLGSVAAALLFGFSYQLQTELSVLRVPVSSFILLMAPYVATIIAVAGLVGRGRAPAPAGKRVFEAVQRPPAPPNVARRVAPRRGGGRRRADLAVVAAGGWAPAADALGTVDAEVPPAELGGFPPPRVGGHAPAVRSVRAGPVRALVFLGRVHLYEGHDVATVVHG